MITIREISDLLEGRETDLTFIKSLVKEYGNLPVKIALLGNASQKRLYNPYWIGCPPGVFLSYKWNGPESKEYVQKVHDYLTNLGYHVYFDKNELPEDADGYTAVPEYIANVANCQYYLLILTEKTADYITARTGKTSWIFDEYQQAITLVNAGRMFVVPLLVEMNGETDFFTRENCIDITQDIYGFSKLDDLFYPVNFKISSDVRGILSDVLDGMDVLLMQQRWQEAQTFFEQAIAFKNIPDYQFRLLIFGICQKDWGLIKSSFDYCADFVGAGHMPHLLHGYARLYNLPLLAENLRSVYPN